MTDQCTDTHDDKQCQLQSHHDGPHAHVWLHRNGALRRMLRTWRTEEDVHDQVLADIQDDPLIDGRPWAPGHPLV